MRLVIGFNRRAILNRRNTLLPWLWREPVHDLDVLYAKGKRVELFDQIIAASQGKPAASNFVAEAANKIAALPPEERNEAAWRLAHNLVVRAVLARKLLEES